MSFALPLVASSLVLPHRIREDEGDERTGSYRVFRRRTTGALVHFFCLRLARVQGEQLELLRSNRLNLIRRNGCEGIVLRSLWFLREGIADSISGE